MIIKILCYVDTLYSLFLSLLLNNPTGNFYFLGENIPEKIAKNLKNYKYLKKEYKSRGWKKDIIKYFFFKKLYLF